MQNKFALKDFILLVLVSLALVGVFLSMRQDDRRWKQNEAISDKIGDIEQLVTRLESKLDSGIVVAGSSNNGGSNNGSQSQSRDESWSKQPGIKINWFGAPAFASDPRNEDDYRIGGTFIETFEAQPSKLTPVLGEDVYARRIGDQVCETLAGYNPETLEFEGELAQAWQYDPEGYWVRVKLRDNARFSDGVPVTAEDVRWSYHDYINNPQLETESLRSVMTKLDRIEVVSDTVIDIYFVEPDAYNLQMALGFYILPKHFYSKFTTTQINQSTALTMGSGPFKFESLDPEDQWTPGTDIVLVRNEQYWGPKPAIASMKFDVITEDVSKLTSFINGDTHMIRPSSPQFVDKISQSDWDEKAYSLKWVNMRSGYSFIGWQCGPRNGKLTPFHDKRVRQAMTLILDRELMIRDIYSGIGEVAIGPNNPPSPAANPDLENYPYDPARAQQLLAEAGWVDRDGNGILEDENGVEFEFEFTRASGGQTIERMQKYLIDQCASVGIRCVPNVVDWSLYDQILKTRNFDAITLAWSASAPESDPKQIWHTDSIQNQGHNFIQWDAGQDKYIDAIKTTLNTEERMKIFHQYHALIHDEQPYTFLRVSPWLRFVSKDFANVHTYPKGIEQREYYMPAN
ncbi:MAG: ABC transporter substrate-binding protein [Phycisphaerales bacterium]